MVTSYDSTVARLSTYSKQRIKELVLAEKNNPGWTGTRAVYLIALRKVSNR